MEFGKKRLSTYSFTYLLIALCYLEEHYLIDYDTLNEYIDLTFGDGKLIMDEINWHLEKLVNEQIIENNDNQIVINREVSPKDIMYIIKVNIDEFSTMVKVVNDFLIYEYAKEKNKQLVKK